MHLKKRIKRNALVVLMPLVIALTGCNVLGNKQIHIHPITDEDFYVRDTGEGQPNNNDLCYSEWYHQHKLGVILENK